MNANCTGTQGVALQPNYGEIKAFLDRLDPNAEYFTFQTFDDKRKKSGHLTRIIHGSLDECFAELVALNQEGAGVFVTVQSTDGKGRKKDNIVQIRAVYQEADRGDEPELPIRPHLTVETSPAKFHRYILTDTTSVEEFAPVQQRLVRDYGSDPNAKDLARVLRVPGFYHQKRDPYMVRIMEDSGKSPLSWEEVKRIFPPVEREPISAPSDLVLVQNIDIREVRDALACLDPDESYDQWIKVGMSLRSTGHPDGFTLWKEWSKRGRKYNEAEMEEKWDSFSPREDGVTIRTLFYLAEQVGYQRPIDDEKLTDSHIDFVNRTYTLEEAFAERPNLDRQEFEKACPGATAFSILMVGCEKSTTDDEKVRKVVNNALLKTFRDLNKDYAATKYEGKSAVIHEYIDPAFGHKTVGLSTPSQANKWVENTPGYVASIVKGKLKLQKINIMDGWWKWRGHRAYPRGLVMAPNSHPKDAYNLFRGFPIEPQKGHWTTMQELILHGLCNGNSEHYEWTLDWMAIGIQKPEERYGVALVLRGAKGIGKGRFGHWYGKLFGQHYRHVTQENHFLGNFNAHLESTLLLFADELLWGGNKSTEGVLKGYVTEDGMMIERKGYDAKQAKNYMRLIVASNEEWAVPAGAGERRWFILDCSSKYKGDTQFFDALEEEMRSGGLEAMMYDLVDREVKSDQRRAPRTSALSEIAQKGFDSVQKYVLHCLETGILAQFERKETDPWPSWIATETLYTDYTTFCFNESSIRSAKPKSVAMKDIKDLLNLSRRRGSKDGLGNRPNGYEVPPLAEARRHFEKAVELPFEWNDEEE